MHQSQFPQLGEALASLLLALVPATIDEAIKDGRLQLVRGQEKYAHRLYLTAKEVSVLLGVKVSTLADWRAHSKGPAFSKPGKQVLYRREDVEAYMESHRIRTVESEGSRPRVGGFRR